MLLELYYCYYVIIIIIINVIIVITIIIITNIIIVNMFSLLRFNSKFRNDVDEVINSFRRSKNRFFGPNETCVAIHIRMDDRSVFGEDMIQWCRNRTTINEKGDLKPKGLSYGQWMNMVIINIFLIIFF